MATIRSATTADAARLAAAGRRLFIASYGNIAGAEDMAAHVEEYFGDAAVASELGRDDVTYLLAEEDGEIAGFLKLRRGRVPEDVPASDALELQQLYVSPDFQRLGIGRMLCDRAVENLRDQGAAGMWLSVWQDADWAIRFYRNYGCHTVGTTDFWLGGSCFADFLMWLPVE